MIYAVCWTSIKDSPRAVCQVIATQCALTVPEPVTRQLQPQQQQQQPQHTTISLSPSQLARQRTINRIVLSLDTYYCLHHPANHPHQNQTSYQRADTRDTNTHKSRARHRAQCRSTIRTPLKRGLRTFWSHCKSLVILPS